MLVKMLFGERKEFLPAPAGSWQVGYVDVLTEGSPKLSSFTRIYYPTLQSHAKLPQRCPHWTQEDTKKGFINFLHSMVQNWPSWVNNSEFGLLGPIQLVDSTVPSGFAPVFSAGWSALADNLRIPTIHQAQLAPAPASTWPVVVFSHGMGCNRFAYSKICYDLASEGVVVVAVEHRDGSASNSLFFQDGSIEEMTHMRLGAAEAEYYVRNKQVLQRADEVRMAVDIVSALAQGEQVTNVMPQEMGYSLDGFKGKLDLSQLFVMGHSFGGSTALLAASNDDRLIGCIALDPWMFPVAEETFELTKPVLVINTEMFVNAANVGKVREVASGAFSAVLAGAVHLMHTDAPFLFRSNLIKSGLGMSWSRDAEAVLSENHSLVWRWLSSHLAGQTVQHFQNWGL